MPRRPQTKTELLRQIAREWDLLLATAEALTDAQMSTPDSGGWTPKDNLAHLAEWLNILLGCHLNRRPLHRVLRVPEAATGDRQIETLNTLLFARNHGRSRREVMARLKRSYAQVLARLGQMRFRELLQPRHADDPKKRPLLLWVLGDTTEHFREHRLTIKRGLRKPA